MNTNDKINIKRTIILLNNNLKNDSNEIFLYE